MKCDTPGGGVSTAKSQWDHVTPPATTAAQSTGQKGGADIPGWTSAVLSERVTPPGPRGGRTLMSNFFRFCEDFSQAVSCLSTDRETQALS